jgi:hypothetical protein
LLQTARAQTSPVILVKDPLECAKPPTIHVLLHDLLGERPDVLRARLYLAPLLEHCRDAPRQLLPHVHLVLPVLRKVVQVVRLRAAVPLALELVQDVDEGLREVRDVDIGLAALARVDVAGVAVLQGEADEVGNLVGVALGGLWQR